MPTFRRGSEGIKSAQTRSSKFVPGIRWDENELKYVQFLQPLEDVVTALMHPFIYVSQKDDGTKIPASFISRRDPMLDGAEGYDPLIDRFGCVPTSRSIALAVELKPTNAKKTEFEVDTRQFETKKDGVKTVPAVGLVIQSPFNFYSHLDALNDVQAIEEKVWAVKRTGQKTQTQYTFMPVADALPDNELTGLVDFFEEFDFDEHLEELASEERMHQLIDPLPDGWVVNQFAGKNKNADKPQSTRARRTEEQGEVEPPPASRQRRFARLAEELAGDE